MQSIVLAYSAYLELFLLMTTELYSNSVTRFQVKKLCKLLCYDNRTAFHFKV